MQRYILLFLIFIFLLPLSVGAATEKRPEAPSSIVDAVARALKEDEPSWQGKAHVDDAVETKSPMWLVGEDALSYWVSPSVGIAVILHVDDVKTYPNPAASAPLPRQITSQMTRFLQNRGLKQDKKNSSINARGKEYYNDFDYRRGFTVRNILCVIAHNNDIYKPQESTLFITDWTLRCATKIALAQAQEKQRPFLMALKKEDRKGVVVDPRVEGVFAIVQVHAGRGGYYAIMKKGKNGKWFEIYEGQDVPPCATLKKYNVPKSVYDGECSE